MAGPGAHQKSAVDPYENNPFLDDEYEEENQPENKRQQQKIQRKALQIIKQNRKMFTQQVDDGQARNDDS